MPGLGSSMPAVTGPEKQPKMAAETDALCGDINDLKEMVQILNKRLEPWCDVAHASEEAPHDAPGLPSGVSRIYHARMEVRGLTFELKSLYERLEI